MNEFVEVKASELIGPALDWAVAKAIGQSVIVGPGSMQVAIEIDFAPGLHQAWAPSVNWSQGGPLIERYLVGISYQSSVSDVGDWCAWLDEDTTEYFGSTALIAACRALVESDVISVPKELMP